ncbi:class I SAM-dependent methyltransferase [Candidatus Nitrosacidococcus sp. I8]|uniref:class I SAM-dependent methyltransferase n=1 Tax=Candidatus Nitrosacidococcus sp. I8 TaxID=2942908 RepID=UPI0022272C65|nr:class I SAM-dependent methyltransferase [Candidatus Nitrosacidococcus sp. I8]CAH9018372.1 hypothetical protein NURINAE_00887 [Candidatus Nitrosacidococcus sp. I8]
MQIKYFSQACENNKQPILERLKVIFKDTGEVLEIGSGTGQHAAYFSRQLPYLTWQPSEKDIESVAILKENLSTLESSTNLYNPIILNVAQNPWSVSTIEGIFSANTLHICAWEEVQSFFQRVGEILKPNGMICIYGPFRYHNTYTSVSNEQFDTWLKSRNPKQGIRDFEAVNKLAQIAGLSLQQDYAMPANNQLLVWQKFT